jgi:UDP-2,3-diacylglucosamine pyrophosphatase LpxH
VDEDLCALLGHYREARPEEGPWELVINGDFVDFIGISLDPSGARLSTEPTEEERAHGLGTAEDHARVKLAHVAKRHSDVFASLAAFVGAGHHLVIIPGNHDREFHWDEVRSDLRRLLRRAIGALRESEAAFLARIRFSSWFFWIEGVAYIEHGDQYDSFCATDHVMAPLSPDDPRRLSPGFSDVLLRFVVHPTRGIRDWDHDHMGLVDYLMLTARLGVRGSVDLCRRFAFAIVELFRLRRLALSRAAEALRAEHERRVGRLAEAMRIDLGRLRALVELQALPVTRSIRGILGSVLLDELALSVLAVAVLALLGALGLWAHHFAWAAALVVPAWWLVHRYLSRSRHVDPQRELAARAGPLSRLFPAAFVVMGHTHVPVRTVVGDGGATYVNTGSWAEDEGAHPDASFVRRAARTHLVIRMRDTGPEAELLAWDSVLGPTRFVSG